MLAAAAGRFLVGRVAGAVRVGCVVLFEWGVLLSRMRETLHIHYGQYYLRDGEPDSDPVVLDTNGTGVIGVGADGDRAFVSSGVHTGTIPLVFEVHDGEPERDFDEWDDVVDVAMDLLSGRVCVDEWGGGEPVAVDLPQADDTYLVRVSVRGRDSDRPEVHRIAVWPGFLIDAPIIWRARDAKGAYRRHAENLKQARAVDIQDPQPRQYIEYDHYWPRLGLTRQAHRMNVPIYAAPGVAVAFAGFTTYPTGCILRLDVTVTRDGMNLPAWHRRVQECRSGFAAGLRLTFACAGEPEATSALRPQTPKQTPVGPTLTGYVHGAVVWDERVVGQHQAWRWPLPGNSHWRMTVEWPELGVLPTEFSI